MTNVCKGHGAEPAVTRCTACGVAMCEACFRFMVRDEPRCVRCAHELRTRARRRVSLGVFMALLSVASAALMVLRDISETWLLVAQVTAFGGIGLGLWLAGSGRARADVALRARLPGERPPGELGSRPRPRAAFVRRAVNALAPRLSGRATALSLLIAMSFSAVSFPALLHQPRWLELELVLGLWWLLASLAFSVLLYRGFQLEDDHFFHAPRAPRGLEKFVEGGCDPGCADVAGCDDAAWLLLVAVGALLSLSVIAAAAWLLVEVVLPLAFLSFYFVAMAALRRVARDRHDCRGHLGLALTWGAAWASVYLVPIAGLVFMLQLVAQRVAP